MTDREEYLTAKEVAALLRISVQQVYRLAAKGALPGVVRIGRLLRFKRAELERLSATRAAVEKAIETIVKSALG